MTAKRPRVVIDARMLTKVPHGIGRYVTRLAQGLDRGRGKAHLHYKVIFLMSPEAHAAGGYHPVFSNFLTVPVQAPYLSPLEWIEIPRVLKREEASLYHSPSFASLPYCPCPWVQTVHDLNHLRFGGVDKRAYYAGLLRPFAKRARVLLTVSENARRELAQWSGVPESKIEICWNAIDREQLADPTQAQIDEVLRRYKLESGRYFLSVANEKPHKNLECLIAAHGRYLSENPYGLPLVLNGEGASPGIIRVGHPDDAELACLLRGARAMVFPSLYEGFGLPPVEAAASGTPVIVSDIPPHREGLGDLRPSEVRWVAPEDVGAWACSFADAGSLERVSRDTRERLFARFDPLRLGRHMDQVYRRVLGLKSDTKVNPELESDSQ